MFPTIFALGLKGLGENTKLGGSFLVMAIVGGAFFPLVLGAIARSTGEMRYGYLVPMVCFAGVGLYGFVAPSCCRSREIPIRRQDCWLRSMGRDFEGSRQRTVEVCTRQQSV